MKTVDKLTHKYALNINRIRSPEKTANLDFKNLNIGFYDDIENKEKKIKKDQKELKKIKDKSFKEFIYTNKEIPEKWRKKINYEDELLNIMIKDKNILTYVSTSPKEEIIKTKSYTDNRNNYSIKRKNNFVHNENNFPNINNRYSNRKLFEKINYKKESEDINNNVFTSEISKKNSLTEENINESSLSKISKMKVKAKNNESLNDKVIGSILEDFKITFPIKEKLQQIYTKTNYYNTDINQKSNDNNIDNKYSTNGKNMSNSLNNLDNDKSNMLTNSKNTFFENIKNQQLFKRNNVFRQNVFNNLVPRNYYSQTKIIPSKKKLKIKPFIDSDYQNFIKKEVINNPIINKNLESINFYGPYFSYCPPCYNRNINFYKNLEINQCLGIVHHIKKMRLKKTLLDIKNKTNLIKNNTEKEKEEDIKSIQSNENNNY